MTLAPPAPPSSLDHLGETTTLAVSYLRVSTKEQAERGGRDEGFSIPAQRDANLRKARDLNAIVIEEFVDAGESARKADRPELMRMIEYVKTHAVAYCIVHKVDRLARNRADDVAIHLALKEAGVMLVSATENIDETPSGMLLHGIMSTIAEFYSRNLANEVSKGMTQKAATGGTVGRAPIGYLNVHKRDELGRDVPTVDLDPDRAALVRWAFEAYATGNYSTSMLHSELVDRGLTTVPTPKRPSKAPGLTTIQDMLSNPYYKGDVIFRGARYDGLHEPLVSAEVWYRVQNVLTAHQVSGEKTQTHEHYLKGTVYCGDCGSRLMVTHAKNRHGNIYPYFMCAGRHSKRTTCIRQAMPISDIEEKVEDYYRRVQIPEHIVTALRHMLTRQFDDLHTASKIERRTLAAERDKLRDERRSLLHAHHAGAVPLDLLKEEQDRIARRLAFLDSRIDAGQIEYDQAKAHLEDCLALAGDMHAIYMSIDDSLRRICNQAFFDRINVYELDGGDFVEASPGEPFDMLLDPSLHAAALAYEARLRAGEDVKPADVAGLNIQSWVVLRRCFSNPRKPIRSLISRVHKASRARRMGRPATQRADTRGLVVERSRQSQTRLNASNRAALLDSYAAEVPVQELADRFGVHRSTVSELVRRAGVPTRSPGLPESIRREAARLYEEGLTLPQVAARLGISNDGARAGIVACGGTIRPRGRQPVPR